MNLTETVVATSLLSLLASWAWPSWQHASQHTLIRQRALALQRDVQWAQWQALRTQQPIRIEPLPACASAATGSWSCGWQLRTEGPAAQRLRVQAFSPTVGTTVAAQAQGWQIDAQGHWASGALRVEFTPAASPSPTAPALTACIANTGRWRFQLGRGCSS